MKKALVIAVIWISSGVWAAGRQHAAAVHFASVMEESESWRFPVFWGITGGPMSMTAEAASEPNYGWWLFGRGGLTMLGKKELLRECDAGYKREGCISHGWGAMLEDAEFSLAGMK